MTVDIKTKSLNIINVLLAISFPSSVVKGLSPPPLDRALPGGRRKARAMRPNAFIDGDSRSMISGDARIWESSTRRFKC